MNRVWADILRVSMASLAQVQNKFGVK